MSRVAAIFTRPQDQATFLEALSISPASTTLLESEDRTTLVTKCTDTLYTVVASSPAQVNSAIQLIGGECCTRAYFMVDVLRGARVANISPDAFEIRCAEHFGDLYPLTEEQQARVQERLFPAPDDPIRELFNMAIHHIVRAPPEKPKKRVKREWQERLDPKNVEPAAPTTAEDDECIICADGNKRTVLFIPCDHLVACEVCAGEWMKVKGNCPVCREPVEDVRRIKK